MRNPGLNAFFVRSAHQLTEIVVLFRINATFPGSPTNLFFNHAEKIAVCWKILKIPAIDFSFTQIVVSSAACSQAYSFRQAA